MFVSCPDSVNTITGNFTSLRLSLAEFDKRLLLVLLLLSRKFVDAGHLLINLLEVIFYVAIHVVHIAYTLRLDVLCAVCVAQSILRLIEMLT